MWKVFVSIVLFSFNLGSSKSDHLYGNVAYENFIFDFFDIEDLKNAIFDQTQSDYLNMTREFSDSNLQYDDRQCRQEIAEIKQGARLRMSGPLRILDAWGKVPSGILSGNLLEFGSFEQCLDTTYKYDEVEDEIHPQYCLGQFVFKTGDNSWFEHERKFKDEHTLISMIEFDHKMPVLRPKRSSPAFNIGMCIPSSCSPVYIKAMLNRLLSYVPNASVEADIQPKLCQTNRTSLKWNNFDTFTVTIFLMLLNVIIMSTAYDIICERLNRRKRDLFIVFSILSNGRKLFTTHATHSPDTVECLYGIRAITTIWIVFGHTFYMYLMMPTMNTAYVERWSERYYSMMVFSAPISVDTFFMISGLLSSMNLLKHLQQTNGRISVGSLFLHRYIRLTPLILFTLLFHNSMMKYTGDGPIWPATVEFLTDKCNKYWWSLLLYIQNYNNPHEICMGHTWYLSVDMQLFLTAPLISYFLFRHRIKTLIAIWTTIALSVACTIATFMKYEESIVTDHDLQMALTYYPTHHRMSTWLIGIILGAIISSTKSKQIHIPKVVNLIAWALSILTLFAIIMANYPMVQSQHDTLPIEDALYKSLGRIAWTLALGYMVFACVNKHGGFVNSFLSLGIWQIVSRLGYAIYIWHFVVLFVNNASTKTPLYFTEKSAIYAFFAHMAIVLIVATIASLAFESPIVALEKIIFARKPKPNLTTKKMQQMTN